MLAARGVARRYGARVALHPTDLDVADAEVLALVGLNGAGKSTLLGMLAGALAPTAGHVQTRPGVRTGWMPQRPAHYGRLSARQNLELFAELEHEADPEAAAGRLLAAFELPRDARPSMDLSVGNRQRLNLALALLGNPNVLLLDEPTASLDPPQRRRLWDEAARLKDSGGSVVLVTQNLEDVERLADRVAVLSDGRLVFEGAAEDYRRSEAAEILA
jgi:ABC-type multidrug transport system ATPase subunit